MWCCDAFPCFKGISGGLNRGLGTPNSPFVLFGPEYGLVKLPEHYVLKGKWPKHVILGRFALRFRWKLWSTFVRTMVCSHVCFCRVFLAFFGTKTRVLGDDEVSQHPAPKKRKCARFSWRKQLRVMSERSTASSNASGLGCESLSESLAPRQFGLNSRHMEICKCYQGERSVRTVFKSECQFAGFSLNT